jgi:hypothetical protein
MVVMVLGVRTFIHYLCDTTCVSTDPHGWEGKRRLINAEPVAQQQEQPSFAGRRMVPAFFSPLLLNSTQSPAERW